MRRKKKPPSEETLEEFESSLVKLLGEDRTEARDEAADCARVFKENASEDATRAAIVHANDPTASHVDLAAEMGISPVKFHRLWVMVREYWGYCVSLLGYEITSVCETPGPKSDILEVVVNESDDGDDVD